jgi:outer membrane protein assembly factor BamD (BamD/ComL family)
VDDADDAEALAAELAILDRTKRALENGDPSGALKQLETHDAQFRDGRLAPEATVLRIEALIASGDTRAAEQRALGFLAKHPKSPLAGRVRALVAAGRPTTGEADDK